MKTVIKTIIASALAAIVAAVFVIFSGVFNVSALWEDPSLLREILVTTREASIEKHAEGIVTPKLGEAGQIINGFRSYREMCAVCHTPPGQSDSPIAQGLNPSPPDLSIANDHAMNNSEIFWVIKNGIRMTGMPAWGLSHDDAEIWDIVAFVKALPGIDAEAYRELDKNNQAGHGHSSSTKINSDNTHMQKNEHGNHAH